MSTLWTPEGEHRVPRESASESPPPHPGEAGDGDVEGAFDIDPNTGLPIDPRTGEPFDPEELAEMQAQLREAQEQLVSVPAAEIVQNHMMGLFELAALHLQRDPPDLAEARLPIDALGLLVEHLADQLPAGDTLQGALQQIRLAYVEIHKQQSAAE
ncbi:hypothetical protein [Candidatus Poriferisodalis sp.]|uniref:hypothetical protein n=1 Tax=Candidatus Poriferisodalis sp. TaxID=3101277 RepID=UPI003B52D1B5